MRENIASERTKLAMANTLEELLQTKSIDKISIHDITDKCNVNRQTFYYHFHDIYELAEWMFSRHTEKLFATGISSDGWDETLLKAAVFIQEKRDLFLSVLNNVGYYRLKSFIFEYIRPSISEYINQMIQKNNEKVDEKFIDFLSEFYTVSLSSFILEWIITKNDDNMSPEDIVKYVRITVDGNIETAIKRYNNKN